MNISAIIKLTVSMALFGSIGFFTVHTGVPATELVFVRCICATLFLGGMWLITGGHKSEVWDKKEILQTIICGVFIVLNWVFLFKAFEEMSISIAISIYNLAPIFVLILGAIFLKEKMTIQALVATITCFIGSIFIIGLQNFVSFSEFMQSGFVWALLSAVFYALTMLTSKTITKLSSYALTYIQTTVGIVMLLPFIDFALFDGLTSTNWFYILGTGFIHTGFVYYLFFDSIRSLSTILVSVLVFVDPVVAILLDMLLLDFMPSIVQTMGILLIFGGIFYTIYVPKKKRLPQEVS
ncbi:DMT family transporter [Lysinibacillus irui]|uniref:DMT family transporter n=1 Tax=Lysinibacillus irui TaxID=2998077 RepID=A0AAJ5RUL2_9BACI|nr:MULTISPECIES: DMT family transporter [Lysinibacillus]MEA0552378.1 DMT family transporter [Lysinibacillus irui]MEA0564014.1 DMT family transporter [Lysinibacillus irui]MEA0977511.1 DMT family transporter [Lysinibacillus irui]MEA1043665.1 DMT family transporter [Lysinibacillus irui]WDV08405.1 DMT family transporter [Lysinibacillus irui]